MLGRKTQKQVEKQIVHRNAENIFYTPGYPHPVQGSTGDPNGLWKAVGSLVGLQGTVVGCNVPGAATEGLGGP